MAWLRWYWRLFWMSRPKRRRAKAMAKLLRGILGGAPKGVLRDIIEGRSCSWERTPEQAELTKSGLEEYVEASKE